MQCFEEVTVYILVETKPILANVHECGSVRCKIFSDSGTLKKHAIFKHFSSIFIFYKDNTFKDTYKERH